MLVRGSEAQPHAAELHRFLLGRGVAVACVTNNSCLTPEEQSQHLAGLGLGVPAGNVITSAVATRHYLDELAPPGSRLMAVGMRGLREALFEDGVYAEAAVDADYVVVGLDLDFDYRTGRRAARALTAGARLVGTNADRARPTQDGLEPEAGALPPRPPQARPANRRLAADGRSR